MKILPRYTNRLQVIFRACLLKALADFFEISAEQCPVLYAGQPIIQSAKRFVTFHKISSTQIGQGRIFVNDEDSPTEKTEIESWIDELTFQVNVRTKETTSDNENTVTARDIADGLRAWFNSLQGIETLREQHIAALKVTQLREIVSTDESELFQNCCSFDVTLHVGQAHSRYADIQEMTLKEVIEV